MLCKKSLCFLIVLTMCTVISAARPHNYSVVYKFRNPDETQFRMIKYFLLDGNKYRTEYYSNIEATIRDTTMTVEYKKEVPEPHTIEILRKDKNLVWTMDVALKVYSTVALRKDAWEHAMAGNFLDNSVEWKKTGENKVLGFACDVYENAQTVQGEKWLNVYYIARESGMVLKSEMFREGKLLQTMEAAEFSTEHPDPSLFELPKGYKKG